TSANASRDRERPLAPDGRFQSEGQSTALPEQHVAGGAGWTTREVQGVSATDPDARLSVHVDILHVRRAERRLLEDLSSGAALELEEEQAGVAEPVAAVGGVDLFRAARAWQEQPERGVVE